MQNRNIDKNRHFATFNKALGGIKEAKRTICDIADQFRITFSRSTQQEMHGTRVSETLGKRSIN